MNLKKIPVIYWIIGAGIIYFLWQSQKTVIASSPSVATTKKEKDDGK
jgi:hypothetical protein